ncbi:MAG: hypothetical protein R2838_21740 [Caldilineaceae bacterium]
MEHTVNGTTTQSHARPLLAVNDLSIDYVNQDGAPAQAVRNVSFTLRGRSARAGGRKRLRQVHVDAAMRLLPSAGRIVGGRRGALSGARCWRSTRAEMADVRWKNISNLPGRHERAQPRAHGRRPDRGGATSAHRRSTTAAPSTGAWASCWIWWGLRPIARRSIRTNTRAACASAP